MGTSESNLVPLKAKKSAVGFSIQDINDHIAAAFPS